MSGSKLKIEDVIADGMTKKGFSTIGELCAAAGVSTVTYYNLLKGQRLKLENINALLKPLGVELTEKLSISLSTVK